MYSCLLSPCLPVRLNPCINRHTLPVPVKVVVHEEALLVEIDLLILRCLVHVINHGQDAGAADALVLLELEPQLLRRANNRRGESEGTGGNKPKTPTRVQTRR